MSDTTTTWRTTTRAVLNRVVLRAQVEGWTRQQFDTAVFDAYPFGVRDYYPYRVWCEERHFAIQAFILNQHRELGAPPFTLADVERITAVQTGQRVSPTPVAQEQLSFF